VTSIAASSTASPANAPRLPGVDALRGFAVAQMIVYHFIYDLDHFGWLDIAMTRDQPWTGWRTAIVTQFLLLVGVSLVLRDAMRPSWRDFWRRWVQIAAAAALVSAGSLVIFGPRFIWIGILHFVAIALILVRLLLPLARTNLLLGAAAVVAGLLLRHEAFDAMATSWIGFAAHKPGTEDYVPLFPWIGVTLIGAALGAAWQRHGFVVPPALRALNAAPPRWLVWLGTWSLTVYLLHQPLLFSVLIAVRKLTG
jgi:uncharacterized membrane protein